MLFHLAYNALLVAPGLLGLTSPGEEGGASAWRLLGSAGCALAGGGVLYALWRRGGEA